MLEKWFFRLIIKKKNFFLPQKIKIKKKFFLSNFVKNKDNDYI